jgi:lipooligosaccharide transport system ATP-binding protein
VMDKGRLIAVGTPRALIAEHIEPNVVEVHGNGVDAWAERARALAPRVEQAGDTVFAYAPDVGPLLSDLQKNKDLIYLHRPASLEDVFLKLTGRDLRD